MWQSPGGRSHGGKLTDSFRIVKWQFDNLPNDDSGLNESRAYACEFVAWQFLCHLTRRETIYFLLHDLPALERASGSFVEMERPNIDLSLLCRDASHPRENERTPLLRSTPPSLYNFFRGARSARGRYDLDAPQSSCDERVREQLSVFVGLNALELATVTRAKRFLSQKVVQRVIDDIWNGEIVFWDSLTVESRKRPQIFNKRLTPPRKTDGHALQLTNKQDK